jgi:hypothetical protein
MVFQLKNTVQPLAVQEAFCLVKNLDRPKSLRIVSFSAIQTEAINPASPSPTTIHQKPGKTLTRILVNTPTITEAINGFDAIFNTEIGQIRRRQYIR